MKKVFLFLIILLSIMFISIIIYFSKDIFVVKNVDIERNFSLNNKILLEYLGIDNKKFIWSYNIDDMEKKMSKDINLSHYKITKKYPDSISIKLYIREPVANITGSNQDVYFIDTDGTVFSKYNINYHIPLIILNKNINFGYNSQNSITDAVNILKILKEKNKDLYNSIAQIEIYDKNDDLTDYVVIYKTINNRIYLKNSINVDLLRRGLVCALYLTEKGLNDRNIYYSGAGFVF